MSTQLSPFNTSLRLNGGHSWIGMYTSRQRPVNLSRGPKWQIRFQDTTARVCADQVQPLPAEREGPVDLMEKARLGTVRLLSPEGKLVRALGGLKRSSGAAN